MTDEIPLSNGEQLVDRNPDGTIKKGVVLNPLGRPTGTRNLSTLLAEALKKASKKADGSDGKTWEELLIDRVIEKAILKGDSRMVEHVWDRLEGKAPQTITVNPGTDADPMIKEKVDALIDDFLKRNDNKGDTQ